MKIVEFHVPGLAETKGSWRAVGGGRMKRDNPREKAWGETVGWAAKARMIGQQPYDGHVAVELVFWLPPPKGKKNRRDVDKLVRSILDAVTGIVVVDDELVTKLLAEKRVTHMPGAIGVDVVVRRAERITYRVVEGP